MCDKCKAFGECRRMIMELKERYLASSDCERAFEWRSWIDRIPDIEFPAGWKIRVIPPFGGAIVRFRVITEWSNISVYLDAYDMLGYMANQPYWELYPNEDGDVTRVMMNETKELIAALKRADDFNKPKDIL